MRGHLNRHLKALSVVGLCVGAVVMVFVWPSQGARDPEQVVEVDLGEITDAMGSVEADCRWRNDSLKARRFVTMNKSCACVVDVPLPLVVAPGSQLRLNVPIRVGGLSDVPRVTIDWTDDQGKTLRFLMTGKRKAGAEGECVLAPSRIEIRRARSGEPVHRVVRLSVRDSKGTHSPTDYTSEGLQVHWRHEGDSAGWRRFVGELVFVRQETAPEDFEVWIPVLRRDGKDVCKLEVKVPPVDRALQAATSGGLSTPK